MFIFLSLINCLFYTLKQNIPSGLALTITTDNVGFTRYDPKADEQIIEIINGGVIKNGRRVCYSPKGPEVILCNTQKPNNGKFNIIEYENRYQLQTNGSQALTVGDYDPNTDMYKAVLKKSERKNSNDWFSLIGRMRDNNTDEEYDIVKKIKN